MSKKHMTDERLKEISGLIGPFTKPFIVEMFYEIAALREENARLESLLVDAADRLRTGRDNPFAGRAAALRDVLESAPRPTYFETDEDGEDREFGRDDEYVAWFHGPRAAALK